MVLFFSIMFALNAAFAVKHAFDKSPIACSVTVFGSLIAFCAFLEKINEI